MTEPFFKVLRWARKRGSYPGVEDFARHVGVSPHTYFKYENGERVPSKLILGDIIHAGCFAPEVAKKLTASWHVSTAKKAGIEINPGLDFDPEQEAESLLGDIEFLVRKSTEVKFSPVLRKLLKDAIRSKLTKLKEA
jgi:transcriptional regulator with XRE-family HTH domain